MRLVLRKDIDLLRQDAIARINGMAGQVRARFVTVIPGQDMIYLEKATEARRFLAAYPTPDRAPGSVDPDPVSGYPFIAGETGITAPTGFKVAMLYAERAATFRRAGAAIDRVRLSGAKRAEAATSPEELETIVGEVAAQLEELPTPTRPGGSRPPRPRPPRSR